MSEPIHYAKGSHVSKLNPAWDWVNRGKDPEGEPEPPEPPSEPVLIDSWPVEQQNDINSYGIMGSMLGCCQAFTAPRTVRLGSVKLSLKRYGNPVGTVDVSFQFATGAFPAVLPVSGIVGRSNELDAATIDDTSGSLYEFTFPIGPQLTQGENYCIVLRKGDDTGFEFGNHIGAGFYFGATGHYGNSGFYEAGWQPDDFADMIFYLYEKP